MSQPNTEETKDVDEEEEETIKLPIGLDTSKLEPSSIKTLTEQKLKTFSVGVQKKSAFQKHKEELEAKRKKEEEEAAKLYENFIEEFSSTSKPSSKTFVRGETVINTSTVHQTHENREYKLEAPVSRDKDETSSKNNSYKEEISNISQQEKKKKRSIDELKEELKRKQEHQNSKYQKSSSSRHSNQNASSSPLPVLHPPVPTQLPPPMGIPGMFPPPLLQPQQIVVQIPTDPEQQAIIHTLAHWVHQHGLYFEKTILEREQKNPKYRFLLQPGSIEHNFYCWKLYSLLQGDSDLQWRTSPFQMYSSGPLWIPPPIPTPTGKRGKESETTTEQKEPKISSDNLKNQFEDILQELTGERESIKHAMEFALDHAEFHNIIVHMLSDSLTVKDTPVPTKMARLYLVSDILHNSSAPVPKASLYRTNFELKLPDIFQSFHETLKNISGRITAENMKEQTLKVLRVWTEWSLYPPHFLKRLHSIFVPPAPTSKTQEEDIDGVPLEEDIDGVPIEEEDIDGVPIEL